MAIPLIDPLPPAPTPADPEPVFDDKAYEMVAALALFIEQANAVAALVDGEGGKSQAQVDAATSEAVKAKASAEAAKLSEISAKNSENSARDDKTAAASAAQSALRDKNEAAASKASANASEASARNSASSANHYAQIAQEMAISGDMQALAIPLAYSIKYALDQAGVANKSIENLKNLAQQEGSIFVKNRGVVSGCSVTKAASRTLSLSGGECFYRGQKYRVGASSATVPPNSSETAEVLTAYLKMNPNGAWVLAVDKVVSRDAIELYRLTVPAGSTGSSISAVVTTDVRRVESGFPVFFDSPVVVRVPVNSLADENYRLFFDIASSSGAPIDTTHIKVLSKATNGFTFTVSSVADDVLVLWKLSKVNN